MTISTLLNKKWRWVSLLVLLGMALFARLGFWQLDRLAQRRTANAQLQQALDQPPFALTPDFSTSDLDSLKDRLVFAQGQYDFAYQGLIKPQNYQGQAGVHLIAPWVLADGQTAVLVNRGWIPNALTTQLSQFEAPGMQTVRGYVGLSQTLSRVANSAPSPDELAWFRLDIEQIQKQIPYHLLPIYIIEWSGEEVAADLPIHLSRDIDLSDGPHLSYAIQWFIFALILGLGYIFFVRQKTDV